MKNRLKYRAKYVIPATAALLKLVCPPFLNRLYDVTDSEDMA